MPHSALRQTTRLRGRSYAMESCRTLMDGRAVATPILRMLARRPGPVGWVCLASGAYRAPQRSPPNHPTPRTFVRHGILPHADGRVGCRHTHPTTAVACLLDDLPTRFNCSWYDKRSSAKPVEGRPAPGAMRSMVRILPASLPTTCLAHGFAFYAYRPGRFAVSLRVGSAGAGR